MKTFERIANAIGLTCLLLFVPIALMSQKFSTAPHNVGTGADFTGFATLQGVNPASSANLLEAHTSTRPSVGPNEFFETSELSASQFNIVLFLIDDLGWKDIGCNGSDYYQTPAIDRLAGEGVRFSRAYSACAVCTPSRAAILTGRYPARMLMTDWTPDGRWNPHARLRGGRFVRDLPLEEFTIAEALREAGYKTISIGKWHLGGPPFSMPEHHGFDRNIGGSAHGSPGQYFFPYAGNWSIPTTGERSRWNVLPDGQPGEYLTDRPHRGSHRLHQGKPKPALFPLFPSLWGPFPAPSQRGYDRKITEPYQKGKDRGIRSMPPWWRASTRALRRLWKPCGNWIWRTAQW